MFLIDDPLSAVDAHVGTNLFQHVFSSVSGILNNKTRILVTNNYSVLPHVDRIFVMENGNIADCGSFADLSKRHNWDLSKSLQQTNDDASEEVETEGGLKTSNQSSTGESATVLIKEEDRQEGRIKLKILLEFFSSFRLKWLLIASVITAQVCSSGSDYWLSLWSDENQPDVQDAKIPTGNKSLTASFDVESKQGIWIAVYALLGIATAFFISLFILLMARAFLTASRQLHDTLLLRVLRSPQSFIECTPVGRILNRFSKDMGIIDIRMNCFAIDLVHLWITSHCILRYDDDRRTSSSYPTHSGQPFPRPLSTVLCYLFDTGQEVAVNDCFPGLLSPDRNPVRNSVYQNHGTEREIQPQG